MNYNHIPHFTITLIPFWLTIEDHKFCKQYTTLYKCTIHIQVKDLIISIAKNELQKRWFGRIAMCKGKRHKGPLAL